MSKKFLIVLRHMKNVNEYSLDLQGSQITDFEEIKGFEDVTNIESFGLHHNKIREILGLYYLHYLVDRYLNGNEISEPPFLSTLSS